ncbi:polysaccharide deacetylase family protein [Candidatus Dojkabacteria bacterium]|nr:polysaccharide deacetylase family protein [Candidatus Dojkabacteria bacterium]
MNPRKRFLLSVLLIQLAVLALVSLGTFPKKTEKSILVAFKVEAADFSQTAPPDLPPMHPPNNFALDYDFVPIAQSANTVRIPVLTYHQIAPLPATGSARDYYVSPEMFDQQMAYLKAKQYKTLSMQEFYDLLKSGENPTQKSILLTFDDGNSNNYTNAFPILKKYDFVGTFFIVSSKSGITSAQQREMVAVGMDIESHSQTHPDLAKLEDAGELTSEISGSKYALAASSGSEVISIAYPGCTADAKALSYVSSAGY